MIILEIDKERRLYSGYNLPGMLVLRNICLHILGNRLSLDLFIVQLQYVHDNYGTHNFHCPISWSPFGGIHWG
jgi:hypothetical protein